MVKIVDTSLPLPPPYIKGHPWKETETQRQRHTERHIDTEIQRYIQSDKERPSETEKQRATHTHTPPKAPKWIKILFLNLFQ